MPATGRHSSSTASRRTIARPGVTFEQAIEQIDIGGPSMLRSAAKNHQDVIVVVDPDDYPVVLSAIKSGAIAPGVSPGTAGVSPGTAGVSPGTAGVSPGIAGVSPGIAIAPGVSPGIAGVSPGLRR